MPKSKQKRVKHSSIESDETISDNSSFANDGADKYTQGKRIKKAKAAALAQKGRETGTKGSDSSMLTFMGDLRAGLDFLSSAVVDALFVKHSSRLESAIAHMDSVHDIAIVADHGIDISGVVVSLNSGTLYAVHMGDQKAFCSCADNKFRKTVCKHVLAVILVAAKLGYISELDLVTLIGA